MLARPSLDRDLHRALVEAGYAPLNEYAEEYMTPQEFEWAQEQIELAYKRHEIGKLTFIRQMSKLGFSLETSRQAMAGIDASRKLQWRPAPHRKNKVDQFADVPDGKGRYLIRRDGKEFRVLHNNRLVSSEPTLDDAIRRAELGASLLLRREI